MFKLECGRTHFYQWDLNQRLIVPRSLNCSQVHFYDRTTPNAVVCEVYEHNGRRVADVPNNLLQTAEPVVVSAYVGNDETGWRTEATQSIHVYARPKPSGYVYTTTETRTWDALDTRIAAVEQAGVSINFGSDNAGKLVYIDTDGSLIPLVLGDGLEIVDGVLTLTGAVPVNTTAKLGIAKLGLLILGRD